MCKCGVQFDKKKLALIHDPGVFSMPHSADVRLRLSVYAHI